ncbi:chain length determinant protein EpsF [Aquabacterium sp.]|uniref:chain length determinant protein EpsF n=1 Tax=Aquabacterium sp. TaxID=1872578 RepID=UPI0035B33DA1
MTFDQFLRIVKARWVLALSIFMGIVVVTLVATLIWPKTYTATASVMVETRPDPVSITNSLATATTSSFVATQVDLLSSQRVSLSVVRQLGLNKMDSMRARWEKEAKGKGDMDAWIAGIIKRSMDIKPSRESNVIEIQYEGSEPRFAAAMANAYAKAFIDANTQLRVDPARQYADFFEQRAKLARDKLEKAQLALAEAQKSKNIIATEERLDVENQRLADLSQQVIALKALRVESSSRSNKASARPDQSTEVLNNMVVATLKSQLAQQEANLSQLQERLGDRHPQVIELQANISALRNRIATETSRITHSVGETAGVNATREQAATAAYEDQRNRMLALKQQRSELAVLEREVDSAQRVYDAIQMRLSQSSLESNNSQPGVMLVSAATEPALPSSPRTMLNMVLAIVLGALLSLIAVLGIELFDRRVRSPFDLLDTLELPVLGVIPNPNKPRNRLIGFGRALPKTSFPVIANSLKRSDSV